MKDTELSLENKITSAASAVVGAAFLVFVAIGYADRWGRVFEMTFISNGISGALLLFSAVRLCLVGKGAPHILFLDCAALLAVVLIICSIFAPATTRGFPSVFLHVVDPILMTAFYLVFCNGKDCRSVYALTALLAPTSYYIFMIVYGRVTGGSVYVYFDPNGKSKEELLIYGIVFAAVIVGYALIILGINKRIRQNSREKNTAVAVAPPSVGR